ncbi:MAG: phosphatidylcholine synthase, partial [Deltaproteobacteria bacterium]
MPFVRLALAWAVHLYTACGAVFGFLALMAAFDGDYRRTFIM